MASKPTEENSKTTQQIFSPEDLLSGQVVVDEISVEQKNIIQKFLEDKYSPKVDAIVKDFADDPDGTYFRRNSPLAFSVSPSWKTNLRFHINWNDTDNRYSYGEELSKYNEVAIIFEDGFTSRSAFGKKSFDNIERKRKIKHISKLEATIIEVLDKQVEIASKLRVVFLESKLQNKKFNAKEKLRELEDELKEVEAFQKKYANQFNDEGTSDLIGIGARIQTKIDTEEARLKEEGLF